MHRLLAGPRLLAVLLLFAVAFAGGWSLVLAGSATAQLPPDDPSRGLVYDGLQKAPTDSLCAGAFQAALDERFAGPLDERFPAGLDERFAGALDEAAASMKQVLCTHGPDPAPEGVDVREDRGPVPAAELRPPSPGTASKTGSFQCHGDGGDGFRVQLVYARSATGADRFDTYAASFRSWAARLDQLVNDSAAKTGGARHIRFVTDSSCNPVVEQVALSSQAMSSFTSMVPALHSMGYARTDRKYLVWADSNVYCGISELYIDDRHDPRPGVNYNNGHPQVQGSIGRVDNGCWGLPNMVEGHELLHLLGGVQRSAPHATHGFHCLDESDRLCYADGSTSSPLRHLCASRHESLYDCNNDDYFNTAPAPGSYLATHWNTADSAFLSAHTGAGPPPTTTTVPAPPPSTTTTPPPTTVAPPPVTTTTLGLPMTTTTAPPAGTTTVPPQTTTTQVPPAGSIPGAPTRLSARQPQVGTGVQLVWERASSGPVAGYRIYRGTSPFSQTLLTHVGEILGYHDDSAGAQLYYYRVSAFNGAGEGPLSTLAGMIGKTTMAAGMVREEHRHLVILGRHLRQPWGTHWA